MCKLALMDVQGRIAAALPGLLAVYDKENRPFIAGPVNRQDIAADAGTTNETVFKTMRTLVAEQVISASRKSIRVHNANRLGQQKVIETIGIFSSSKNRPQRGSEARETVLGC